MKRSICILLAGVLLLAACGSKDSTSSEADTATDSSVYTESAAGTDPTEGNEVTEPQEEKKNVFSMHVPAEPDEKYWANGAYSFLEINSITFLSSLAEMPEDAMDVSKDGDGGVMSWVKSEGGKSALYIAADGGVWFESGRTGLFSSFQNVESVSFNNSVRTDDVIIMFGMFRNLRKLKTVDLSGINTSNVLSMESMFAYCEELETVDLTGFDTPCVYNMDCMFYDCCKLKTVDMSGFDFSNVEYIRSIFENCKELTDIGCEIVLPETAQSDFMYENCGLTK